MQERTERGTARIERGNARWNRATAILAALSTVLTLGGILLTTYAASQSQTIVELRADLDQARQDLAVANETITIRESDIEDLKQRNEDLLIALPPTVDPDDIPDLRAAGTVTLTESYELDLDSVVDNFDQQSAGSHYPAMGLRDSSLRFNPAIAWVSLAGVDANFASCSVATGWREAYSLDAGLMRSEDICLRLRSGRVATVVVTDIQSDSVTVAISVWELPV